MEGCKVLILLTVWACAVAAEGNATTDQINTKLQECKEDLREDYKLQNLDTTEKHLEIACKRILGISTTSSTTKTPPPTTTPANTERSTTPAPTTIPNITERPATNAPTTIPAPPNTPAPTTVKATVSPTTAAVATPAGTTGEDKGTSSLAPTAPPTVSIGTSPDTTEDSNTTLSGSEAFNVTTEAPSKNDGPTDNPAADEGSILYWLLPVLALVLIAMAVGGFYIKRYVKRAGYRQSSKTNGDTGKTGTDSV